MTQVLAQENTDIDPDSTVTTIESAYKKFLTDETTYTVAVYTVNEEALSGYDKDLETIRGMISRWAPPSENHTEIYIRAVADAVGIADDRPVDTRDRTTMLRMAAAISRVENGTAADMDDVERGWELFRQ